MQQVFASFETLEDLFDLNLTDPTEESLKEGLPKSRFFEGGEVHFLKEAGKNAIPLPLPLGAEEVSMPSWSSYRVFLLPPVLVEAEYSIVYEGEEKLLIDQEATLSTYKRTLVSILLKVI